MAAASPAGDEDPLAGLDTPQTRRRLYRLLGGGALAALASGVAMSSFVFSGAAGAAGGAAVPAVERVVVRDAGPEAAPLS